MLFQAYLGRFWGRSETQSYLRTRHALAKALLQIKTYDAVKAAHDHLMDILHLDRGDSMEVRDLVPALKLRLGRDQECYAFCVWYAMSRKGGDFWWYNMDVSVFTNVNAKVLNFFDQRTIMSGASLRHKISVVLLKIRSYLALQSLRNASLLVEKVPQEIIIAIREQVVCESIFGGADEIDLYDVGSQTAAIRILQAHIKELYQAINDSSEYIWPALLDFAGHSTALPDTYNQEASEDWQQIPIAYNFEVLQNVFQNDFDAWIETPGAIRVIRDLSTFLDATAN